MTGTSGQARAPGHPGLLAPFLTDAAADRPPLRIGIMLDDLRTLRVFAELVEALRAMPWLQVVRVVMPDAHASPPAPRRGAVARAAGLLRDPVKRKRLLYSVYDRLDRRNVAPAVDPFAPVDVADALAGVPVLRVRTTRQGWRELFPDDAIATLRADDLDVLFRCGFGIIDGAILSVARHGVWSFHHGDSARYRGAPPALWELIEDAPESGAVLQVLSAELDAGRVLARGIYPTVRGLSAARNRLRPYWGTRDLALTTLYRLHRDGPAALAAHAVDVGPYAGRRRIYRAPGNGDMAGWVARSATGWLADRLSGRRPIDQEWDLAIRRTGTTPLGDGTSYTPIRSPGGRFLADPCLVTDGDDTWLFVEDWSWATRRAGIAVARVAADGTLEGLRPVLERPYHLSFPFVFRHEGDWFMIPESKGAGRVELLRARRFPDEWVTETVLHDGPAVDTVLHRDGDAWYVFTTLVEARSGASAHCIFTMATLGAPWRWHPASPLSTTLAGYRSAGALVHRGGRLLRPVQDARRGYGLGLEWRAVTRLDAESFTEEPIDTLRPPPGYEGGHTWTSAGGWDVIDLCWSRPRRSPPGTRPAS